MEKADQRKQEHQAKQAHRRESEPGPNVKEKEKEEEKCEPKVKRRRFVGTAFVSRTFAKRAHFRRKGRSRTVSTNAQNNQRRNRLNSTDSYLTSGDEALLSPTTNDSTTHSSGPTTRSSVRDQNASGDGLNLSGKQIDKRDKTPPPRTDSKDDSNNSVQSSPETTHLSSACLLVQAAVEPLEPGFKFPKTKKVSMF